MDYPGTEKEQLTLYFDFLDAVLEKERQQIAGAIQQQTGWPVVFSPSVRQDLLQVALAKLLGQTIQSPSIHLHERKIAVSIDGSAVDEALLVQFKQMTGFDVEWKNGSGNSSSALAQQEVFQANTTSKRMENNQAIEEAKRWAIERGITMYKAAGKHDDHGGALYLA